MHALYHADPLFHDLVFVLQLLEHERFECIELAQQLGVFRLLSVERRVLRGDGLLPCRILSGGWRCTAGGNSAPPFQRKERRRHCVNVWMNFLVMSSSALRSCMSTLRSSLISRMFSERSSII